MSTTAKDLLQDPTTPAVVLMAAARSLLQDEFAFWEPESTWIELQHHGVDLPEENRARLMAGVALRLVPSFYWDAIVFEKTALSFDGVSPSPEILEEATPSRMAWAVVESAEILRRAHDATWEFGHEPRAYAGVVLHRAGFVVAPEQLSFAQNALDREGFYAPIRDQVRERWASVDKDRLETLELQETPIDVQIARLAAVELHVRERRARVARDLPKVA